jgi:hypothetical protein
MPVPGEQMVVAQGEEDGKVLEPILWNRFGRNLRIKLNFVKFEFGNVTLLCPYKVQAYCP